MKKSITLILLLFLGINLMAQEIEIPNDLKFETEADYKASEGLVLESIEWIQNTPVALNPTKRQEVNRFLILWITGTPSVSIELLDGIVPLDCSECLIPFLAGWTKYSLQNNYSKDKVEGALAGLEQSISFYEKNKADLGKNKEMEKLIKRQQKGTLRKFVESKF